jgi:demethylspheroidene O-methyltransferase
MSLALADFRPAAPLLERWFALRDRLLASPKFQSWAAKFPLTRPIARREARALFDLCAGFVYAQTLSACVALDLFEILAFGPMDAEHLAARCKIPAPAMRTLLDAAVSLRLLAIGAAGYRLGPLGAALRGNPGIAAMVAHHRLFYADLADPVLLLRGLVDTELSRFWPYQGRAGDPAGYSALMAATQPMIAGEILAAYDVAKHAGVLDVGGGDGAFLCQLAARAPKASLTLFDLPAVADQATARFQAAGLARRARAFGGDVFADKLPDGADLTTLVRVLHDHDDARASLLLRNVRAAVPPGGTLLVAEPLAGTVGAAPIGAAYFGFYLLAMGSGRPRTFAEIAALLTAAGFTQVKQIPTNQPMLTGLVKASVSFS